MKKLLSILIASLFLLSSVALLPVFADGETTGQTPPPDWIITEVSPDQRGLDGNTNGYTSDITADCFEFIEIYNNSGKELDLYEYAVTYNGSARDSAKFEHQITEYTPIKPGDYLDGSNLIPTEPTHPFGDLSNKPVNPDTCVVAPGEVVVLWMVYLEAYQARFNDGKGMSVADFRAHWNIPEDVKVIAVDANGNAKNGGFAQNFNVKNSAVGTYGIIKQSEELEAACNIKDAPGLDGNYWESDLVCWATVDFTDMLLNGSADNVTYNFTWDFGGYATIDQSYTYYTEESYVYDARRCFLLTMYDEPTAGKLNTIQKMTLGIELAEGESVFFDSAIVYFPLLEENILGLKVNGEFYKDDSTFTAPAAGVYTFDYFLESDEMTETTTEAETQAPDDDPAQSEEVTEEATQDVTEEATDATTEETPTEPVSEAVSEETTSLDTDGAATVQETEAPAKGGCGAVMALAILPCLAAAAWMARKREN